mmetsp:Transcript_82199/g.228066  ORF Transcript_82199/g.228066 Transcript_82199/m.228066 type:complete len:201 (-) Transcript_82199:2-604(-)
MPPSTGSKGSGVTPYRRHVESATCAVAPMPFSRVQTSQRPRSYAALYSIPWQVGASVQSLLQASSETIPVCSTKWSGKSSPGTAPRQALLLPPSAGWNSFCQRSPGNEKDVKVVLRILLPHTCSSACSPATTLFPPRAEPEPRAAGTPAGDAMVAATAAARRRAGSTWLGVARPIPKALMGAARLDHAGHIWCGGPGRAA